MSPQIDYPEIAEGIMPRHRFMSAYEQRIEPPDRRWQYLLMAAEPYETIAFKVGRWSLSLSLSLGPAHAGRASPGVGEGVTRWRPTGAEPPACGVSCLNRQWQKSGVSLDPPGWWGGQAAGRHRRPRLSPPRKGLLRGHRVAPGSKARLHLTPAQVPSREIDKAEGKFWTHWNRETKQVGRRRSGQFRDLAAPALAVLSPTRGPTQLFPCLSSSSCSSTSRWRSHQPRQASRLGLLG